MSAGRTWLRRAGYSGGCLLWLFVMCLPLAAFVLAVNGELSWERGEFARDRLWLVRETEQEGLGYAAARVISNEEAVDGPICVRTRVYFLLWKGSADEGNVAYCECYTAGLHELAGECPQ